MEPPRLDSRPYPMGPSRPGCRCRWERRYFLSCRSAARSGAIALEARAGCDEVIDTILTATSLFALVILFLAVLGVMRETVILRGEVAALSQLILVPPDPPYIRDIAPLELRNALMRLDNPSDRPERLLVLFLSGGCSSCQRVVRELGAATSAENLPATSVVGVVSKSTDRDGVHTSLVRLGARILNDPSGSLTKACGILITPSALEISTSDFTVLEFEGGVTEQWLLNRIEKAGLATP